MKRHWLRGLLLGVSLASLLGGGVALAQSVSVEPYCSVCCNRCTDPLTCDEGFVVSSSGWPAGESLFPTFTSPSGLPYPLHITADGDGEVLFDVYVMCPECINRGEAQILDGLVAVLLPPDYGEWTLEVEDTAGKVGAEFYLAEDSSDCQVEEEFVPEPGTIVLLGSGFTGLAGYATLRWRARQ